MLYYVYETEAKEIEWDMHEVWGAVRHEPNYISVMTDDLRLHVSSYVFLYLSHALRLLHVEGLAL